MCQCRRPLTQACLSSPRAGVLSMVKAQCLEGCLVLGVCRLGCPEGSWRKWGDVVP